MMNEAVSLPGKTAEECTSLGDIRQEIDRIDNTLMTLIAERYTYVKATAPFKHNAEEIKAQERYDAVLAAKRQLAVRYGLDPDMIESMWKTMMDWFIVQETHLVNGEKPF